MSDEMPRTFAQEFAEVTSDVRADFYTAFETLDPDLGTRLQLMLNGVFRGFSDPAELMQILASLNLAFFMAGREHALRGYASPIERGEAPPEDGVRLSDLIPDDLSGL